jgi:hypothetical protein
MTPEQAKLICMDFMRMGGRLDESWEATAMTLVDRLNQSEARAEKLSQAMGRLLGDAEDMVQSRSAWKQLRDGFVGMGHNILVERCGLWQSISGWHRLERSTDRARAVLDELYDSSGNPRWKNGAEQ